MPIVDHWLQGLSRKTLTHKGTTQTPRLVVIHYSVTDTVAQAVTTLNKARLSYHVLIEKDGTAFQTRRFSETAAHPGLSNWKPQGDMTLHNSVSRGSIGICLMNRGYDYGPGAKSAPGKLIYNPDDPSMQRWELYPAKQLAACRAIVNEIVAAYPITEVVGHHDIAIMGKFDPGPLIDLVSLNAIVSGPTTLGFRTTINTPDAPVLLTPSKDGKTVTTLKKGIVVHVRSVAYGARKDCVHPSPPSLKRYLTRWASVDLDASDKHFGFVNLAHLTATPLVPELEAHL
jgi:hypothetical protein